jgi:hypothetical protein
MADENGNPPGTRSIPINWGTNPHAERAKEESLIQMPNLEQQLAYADAHHHVTCGTCRKFRLKMGQDQMQKERFLERLVIEEQWKTKHLGAPPTTMGLCAETSDTITSAFARGCEHYRPRNGRTGDR